MKLPARFDRSPRAIHAADTDTAQFFVTTINEYNPSPTAPLTGTTGETLRPLVNKVTYQDLNWLNAYNAPHWVNYAGQIAKNLEGTWLNKSGSDATNPKDTKGMGTSWVFDLMLASKDAATAMGRTGNKALWFNGTGSLGTRLNLGINDAYIGKNNQDRVDGKDKVLGVIPTKADGLPNAQAFTNQQWSLANATALAAKLKNPTVDSAYIGKSANAAGANQQDQALLDFLSVFAATQSAGADPSKPNGYWDSIAIQNKSTGNAIKKALFGDGTQTGGIIDSKNVLIGGTAAPLGAAMTAQALGDFMGNISGVNYANWVEPLKVAMQEFGINTPQRIAAFLAQVKAEGNLQPKPESFIYTTNTANRLANTFKSAFSYQFNYSNHTSPAYRAKLAHDRYNDDSRTREQNAQLFYDEVLSPALMASGGNWTDDVQALIANRVYSSDYGTGMDRDPQAGDQASGDGWKYRGHGQLQLTGKSVITQFADYVRDNYAKVGQTQAEAAALRQRIIDTPDILDTDKALAARSAGWEWGIKKNVNPSADQLNESPAPWSPNNLYTTSVTKRIATATESFEDRYINWQKNVKLAYAAGNPYETMREVLSTQGFKSSSGKGFEGQFGISLQARKAIHISDTKQLLVTDQINTNTTLSATAGSTNDALEALLTTAKQTLNLAEGAFTVLAIDHFDLPDFSPSVAIMAKADGAESGSVKSVRSVGVCGILQLTRRDAYTVDAEITARSIDKATGKLSIDPYDAQVTVIQQPKHGKLWASDGEVWTNSKIGSGVRSGGAYEPTPGFIGKDSFVMQVEGNGHKVKVYYFIAVTPDDGYIPGEHCKKLGTYKISRSTPQPDNGTESVAAWLKSAQLSALIASATQSLTGFTNLPGTTIGTTIGTTTGQGTSAQITLDTDAAGHGWYVDETPLDNTDDYLPTSDPTLWKAKTGSAADGKMDLLSVLLHEYGHALGLEHSADARDFMGESLQAGERRLPSAQELQLMAKLVAQLKNETTADNPPGLPILPLDSPQDIPLNGLALAGLLGARRRSGTDTCAGTGSGRTILSNKPSSSAGVSVKWRLNLLALAPHPSLPPKGAREQGRKYFTFERTR